LTKLQAKVEFLVVFDSQCITATVVATVAARAALIGCCEACDICSQEVQLLLKGWTFWLQVDRW